MENQVNFFTVQDMWDEMDKQIPIDCTKVYDPLLFWEDFGDKYFKSFKKMPDIQRNLAWSLHKLGILKVDTLLDVGCGFCRLDPFFIDGNAVKEITAVDFSPKQLACAEEYLKEFPKKDKIHIINASVKKLSFENNSFDCVYASEVLQHIPPQGIYTAIREMARVAKKYVVMVERFVYDGEHPQPHLWSHNYTKLGSECGLKLVESKLIGNGILGMIWKK